MKRNRSQNRRRRILAALRWKKKYLRWSVRAVNAWHKRLWKLQEELQELELTVEEMQLVEEENVPQEAHIMDAIAAEPEEEIRAEWPEEAEEQIAAMLSENPTSEEIEDVSEDEEDSEDEIQAEWPEEGAEEISEEPEEEISSEWPEETEEEMPEEEAEEDLPEEEAPEEAAEEISEEEPENIEELVLEEDSMAEMTELTEDAEEQFEEDEQLEEEVNTPQEADIMDVIAAELEEERLEEERLLEEQIAAMLNENSTAEENEDASEDEEDSEDEIQEEWPEETEEEIIEEEAEETEEETPEEAAEETEEETPEEAAEETEEETPEEAAEETEEEISEEPEEEISAEWPEETEEESPEEVVEEAKEEISEEPVEEPEEKEQEEAEEDSSVEEPEEENAQPENLIQPEELDDGILTIPVVLEGMADTKTSKKSVAQDADETEPGSENDTEQESESDFFEPLQSVKEWTLDDTLNAVEAILFASSDPVSVSEIAEALAREEQEIKNAILQLQQRYNSSARGITIRGSENNRFSMAPKKEICPALIRLARSSRKIFLSETQLEVLSLVAFRQPITRAQIDEVRGFRSSQPLARLQEFGLVKKLGGNPMQYGITDLFVELFEAQETEPLAGPEEGTASEGESLTI